jgi:hypothetical protein
MSKKIRAPKITPSQEDEHTVYATMRLAEAHFTLKAIGRLCKKCATDKTVGRALLNSAIILYGSVFKGSDIGGGKKHKIVESIVPKKHKELHKRLIEYRDKFVAHFDLTYKKPILKKR